VELNCIRYIISVPSAISGLLVKTDWKNQRNLSKPLDHLSMCDMAMFIPLELSSKRNLRICARVKLCGVYSNGISLETCGCVVGDEPMIEEGESGGRSDE
jgi:hypothetical protein